MKPWNKIKWMSQNYRGAQALFDDFERWMQEPCELFGVRRWDCQCRRLTPVPANSPARAVARVTEVLDVCNTIW